MRSLFQQDILLGEGDIWMTGVGYVESGLCVLGRLMGNVAVAFYASVGESGDSEKPTLTFRE